MHLRRFVTGQNDFHRIALAHADDIRGRLHLALLDRDGEFLRLCALRNGRRIQPWRHVRTEKCERQDAPHDHRRSGGSRHWRAFHQALFALIPCRPCEASLTVKKTTSPAMVAFAWWIVLAGM